MGSFTSLLIYLSQAQRGLKKKKNSLLNFIIFFFYFAFNTFYIFDETVTVVHAAFLCLIHYDAGQMI